MNRKTSGFTGTLLALGCLILSAEANPFLEVKFHQGSSTSLANTGTAGTAMTLSAPNPTFSTNAPFGGGAYSMDIATAAGTSAVDGLTGEILNAAKDLKSFTIMGWLNCRSGTVSPGGNRIISWYQHLNNADGVDLAMTSSGALSLGVKSWNDNSGASSNSGKITVDTDGKYNNWRFFAVTYDETASSGHVKFYFGTSTSPAELDRTLNYDKGSTGSNIAPSVTLGNHSTATRNSSTTAAFRGLMDEIRVFGSKSNATGALSLSAIQTLQGAAPLAGQPGLLYERWNNITGSTIASLTSNSRFPATPDQTLVRPTSEAFQNVGDNFGVKLSGWIEAPETGNYIFGLTTDDAGELRLSSNANPVNKQLIASQATWASYSIWAVQSAPIPLEAGKFYYIEALMKENVGGDHLKVGWRRPSDTQIGIIVAPALHVTPPETDILYPSAYHLYEQGTGTRKATMGWEKDGGNSHYYIEAEGHRSLTVQDGSVIVPDRLGFGGKFPNDPDQNDLGFRWERENIPTPGILHLETKGGKWAMRVRSASTEVDHEMEPHVEFNQSTSIHGPDYQDEGNLWSGFASTHNVLGTYFERSLQNLPVDEYHREISVHSGAGMTVTRNMSSFGFIQAETTQVSGGRVLVKAKDPYGTAMGEVELTRYGLRYEVAGGGSILSQTVIDGEGLSTTKNVHANEVHADKVHATSFVSTPKWQVVPDYVFEKDYKLRSLEETERFVREKKHLPEIPSAREMSTKGLDLTDMNLMLLKKVEELTLHMIAMDKEMKAQRRDNSQLKREVRALRGVGKGH